ncbi:hypothetical protein SYNPS1DRAFT_26419 [Syncephalis pseudoplumigaleata]|uniref:ubiquitinyl hydrolase 1 n=1 Tax=Syncephalis pseudoplumigaleata TaxID=1712513 RepID=A0A4P9Z5Q3_9FUNG|nr:hypothetical protein SYNPS1DRAFT_26419 [Syncephalis pseudoplumigaleata]|eukprot:RKP27957.1 hypothetical protein SYNPS1DRAFT_26419 [Syncephalis pseudoplumigaleata]
MAASPAMLQFLDEMRQDHEQLVGDTHTDQHASLVSSVLLATLEGNHNDPAHLTASCYAAINAPTDAPAAFRPRQLTQSLAQHRRVVNREQQDAHEFFQILSATLTQEAAKVNEQRRIISLLDSSVLRRLIGGAASQSIHAYAIRSPACLPVEYPASIVATRTTVINAAVYWQGPIRHFPFDNLSLSPPLQFSCSLAYCLEQYIQLEVLDDFSCRRCSLVATQKRLAKLIASLEGSGEAAVKEKACHDLGLVEAALATDVERELPSIKLVRAISRQTTKQVMIAQPPPLLCLHISRSTFSYAGDLRKNGCWVRFPIYLNLAPYCTHGQLCLQPTRSLNGTAMSMPADDNSDDDDGELSSKAASEVDPVACRPSSSLASSLAGASGSDADDDMAVPPIWYRLRSVVIHYGGHHYGHFVAFRQAALSGDEQPDNGGGWFRVSDDAIRGVPVDDVQNENPYLLIYERDPTVDAGDAAASNMQLVAEKRLAPMNDTLLAASLEQRMSMSSADGRLPALTTSLVPAMGDTVYRSS